MKNLNDQEKIFLSQYYEFKKNYPNIYFYIKYIIIILFFIPLIIWISYFIGDRGYILIYTSLNIGDALGFYGSVLSFIGTVSLGIVALWQGHKANQINVRLLSITEDKEIPTIDIIQCNFDEFKKNNLNQIEINVNHQFIMLDDDNNPMDNCEPFFVFKVRNVKNNDILSIKARNIECISKSTHSKNFRDVKNIHNDIFYVSYNIDSFILAKQSECYLFISGCHYESPSNSSIENIYNYQGLQLNLEFEIMNNNGKIYIQKTEITVFDLINVPTENIIIFPIIASKEIISIQEIIDTTN